MMGFPGQDVPLSAKPFAIEKFNRFTTPHPQNLFGVAVLRFVQWQADREGWRIRSNRTIVATGNP